MESPESIRESNPFSVPVARCPLPVTGTESVSVSAIGIGFGIGFRLRDRLEVHVQGSVGNDMMVAAKPDRGAVDMAKKQHTYARAKRKRNAKRALDTRAREQQAAATKAAPR